MEIPSNRVEERLPAESVQPEQIYTNESLIEDIPLHPAPLPKGVSDEDISLAEQRREELEDSTELGSVWKAIREQDAIVPALQDIFLNDYNFPVDIEWQGPKEEQLAELYIPIEFHHELYKTVSEEDFLFKVGKIELELENEQTIANYGVKGAWLRFVGNILDEGNLALAASLPLLETGLPEALAAHKVGRLGASLKTALALGTENAGIQALINASNLTSKSEDIGYAALYGIGFGGVMGGALHRSTSELLENSAINTIREADEYKVNHVSSVGAAEVTGPQANQSLADNPITEVEKNTPETAFSDVRLDVSAQISKSGIHSARKLGSDWVEDGVGKKGHAVNSQGGSASTIQRQTQKKWLINYRKSAEPIFQNWLKTNVSHKDKFLHPIKYREDFNKAVMRQIELEDNLDPDVIRAADIQRKIYKDVLEELKEVGVFGAKDIPNDPRYVPHLWQPALVRKAVDETNEATISRLFFDSMTKGLHVDGVEAGHLHKVATAIVRRFNVRASSIDDINGYHLNLTDAEELKTLLRESTEEIDEGAIEQIVEATIRRQKGAGKPSFLKRRMDLDMSVTARGANGKEISLYDLMETDSEKVMLRYLQKASGLVGFARKGYGKETSLTSSLSQALKRVEDEARSSTDPKVREAADRTISNLKHAADAIQGKPLDDFQLTPLGRGLRLLSDASFVRLMGQSGAASFAELGQVIGYTGIINAVRQFLPTFSQAFETVKKGGPEAETLSTELEALGMFGGHSLNNKVNTRFNDHDVEMINSAFKRIDDGLQVGKKLTVQYSGLALVTDWTQELSARAMSQRFYHDALESSNERGFEEVWARSWKRMHLYGLTKENAEEIYKQIRKHAEGRQSTWMKTAKLGRLNLKKWDKEPLDQFTQVMFRMTTHAVQEMDVGNLPAFMHKDVIKVIFQFRSFVAGAYAKSTLNGLHMRDTQAGVALVASMALGWLSYVAQNTLNSIGREDEWLDERLDTERQLAAAFSRSAFASVTPAFFDALLEAGGQEQAFNKSRTTGLTQLSIPAVDTVQAVSALGSTAISPLTPREVTEGDMDGAMRLISNLWGVRNLTAAIDDGVELPKQQER